ncbi:MAG: YceI family protein [Bacteroidales bacterium]|nr:YceI family protein [Bacteroidales bacterium]
MKRFAIRSVLAVMVLFTFLLDSRAQDKYFTRTGHVYFLSHTDVIDIDGNNNQVTSFLNIETGEMVFAVLIKSFEFTLATAKEHFNESYMESHIYPKSKFSGKISNIEKIDFKKDGLYNVTVEGDLTIHGITKTVSEPGTLEVKGSKIYGKSKFEVAIDDYDIKVPKIVEDRVAKIVDVEIDMIYEPYTK